MPARFQPQAQVQRPLQNEISALTKLINGELLEAAAKVLLHQVQVRSGNEQDLAPAPPRHLMQTLEARCEEFATICDQIYYILDQSRRILILDQKAQHQQQLQQQKLQQSNKSVQQDQGGAEELMAEDTDISDDLLASGMDEDNDLLATSSAPVSEDVDIEELVQVQRERLERLRRVIVLGEDADKVKQEGEGRPEGDGDYLF